MPVAKRFLLMSQYDIDIREKLKKLHKNTVYATKEITGRLYKLFGSEVHSVLLYTATKITKFTHKIRKKTNVSCSYNTRIP